MAKQPEPVKYILDQYFIDIKEIYFSQDAVTIENMNDVNNIISKLKRVPYKLIKIAENKYILYGLYGEYIYSSSLMEYSYRPFVPSLELVKFDYPFYPHYVSINNRRLYMIYILLILLKTRNINNIKNSVIVGSNIQNLLQRIFEVDNLNQLNIYIPCVVNNASERKNPFLRISRMGKNCEEPADVSSSEESVPSKKRISKDSISNSSDNSEAVTAKKQSGIICKNYVNEPLTYGDFIIARSIQQYLLGYENYIGTNRIPYTGLTKKFKRTESEPKFNYYYSEVTENNLINTEKFWQIPSQPKGVYMNDTDENIISTYIQLIVTFINLNTKLNVSNELITQIQEMPNFSDNNMPIIFDISSGTNINTIKNENLTEIESTNMIVVDPNLNTNVTDIILLNDLITKIEKMKTELLKFMIKKKPTIIDYAEISEKLTELKNSVNENIQKIESGEIYDKSNIIKIIAIYNDLYRRINAHWEAKTKEIQRLKQENELRRKQQQQQQDSPPNPDEFSKVGGIYRKKKSKRKNKNKKTHKRKNKISTRKYRR